MGYFFGLGQGTKLYWCLLILVSTHFLLFGAPMVYFWGWGRVQKLFWGLLKQTIDFCFLSFALSCSFEFVWCRSQQLLCLNPTTVMVVLLIRLQLLLGCDNYILNTITPYLYLRDFLPILCHKSPFGASNSRCNNIALSVSHHNNRKTSVILVKKSTLSASRPF